MAYDTRSQATDAGRRSGSEFEVHKTDDGRWDYRAPQDSVPKRAFRRCRTCHHWRERGIPDSRRTGYCNAMDVFVPASDPALIEVCSAGNATVYTAPNFGCVLWKPKR